MPEFVSIQGTWVTKAKFDEMQKVAEETAKGKVSSVPVPQASITVEETVEATPEVAPKEVKEKKAGKTKV